jgi:hypothetical protein
MEHKTLDEIRDFADILPTWPSPRRLSKSERLEHWAEALDREGARQLNTLFEIEYAPPAERAAVRVDDSPLSVAFNDARLRAEGLSGDTVGDAVAFFGVSEMELHDILCFCYHGETMAADAAAMRVRAATVRRRLHARPMLVGALVAASVAVGSLVP